MREDMARVIVEHPRIKPRNNRKGRRLKSEDLPKHEGMRRCNGLRGGRKELNENLAPLRRYLESQVGRSGVPGIRSIPRLRRVFVLIAPCSSTFAITGAISSR
ncbi:MAG: hypothetical protein P4M15_13725 [Alphaproteobacteria bacterium]|nr:hypothetical protein [Alphaproteobacteria bacterium]